MTSVIYDCLYPHILYLKRKAEGGPQGPVIHAQERQGFRDRDRVPGMEMELELELEPG